MPINSIDLKRLDGTGVHPAHTGQAIVAKLDEIISQVNTNTAIAGGSTAIPRYNTIAARDAIIPTAGLLVYVIDASDDAEVTSGNATYLYDGTDWQKVADADAQTAKEEVALMRQMSGTSAGDSTLGVFTGSTISDNVSLKVALQDLETALEAGGGADIVAMRTLSGTSTSATTLGTFTGSTIADGRTIKAAIQDLETALETVNPAEASALRTLSGTAISDTSLGTFTGFLIPSSVTIKSAMQTLESEAEANRSLSGTSLGATNLGTFTGSLIPDGQSVRSALQVAETEIQAQRTTIGTTTSATHLGTFSGSTIPDTTDVVSALQALETALEGLAATDIPVADAGGYYTSVTVEAALQEVALAVNNARTRVVANITARNAITGIVSGETVLVTDASADVNVASGSMLYIWNGSSYVGITAVQDSVDVEISAIRDSLGTSSGATDLGVFTGDVISNNVTLRVALQDLEDAVDTQTTSITDILSVIGVSDGATSLGVFSGSTISDNTDIATALQQLETAVEATSSSAATGITIADAGGYFAGGNVELGLQEVGDDLTDIRSVLGLADGESDLGTFTGATIGDNVSLLTALQQLETAVEATSSTTATGITVTDSGGYFAGGNVELVTQELGDDIANFFTLLGVVDDATDLGTFSGSTISDGATVRAALQQLETAVESATDDQTASEVVITDSGAYFAGSTVEAALQEVGDDISDFRSVLGVSDGDSDLGSFSGSTITDNSDLVTALQDLETAVEAVVVPDAASSAPVRSAGNSGTIGSSTDYARADHVHPAFFHTVDTKATGVYTTTDADFGQYIRVDNNVTIHASSTAPVGSEIHVRYTGAGSFTLVADTGVTFNGNVSLSQNETLVVKKVAADEFDITGGAA